MNSANKKRIQEAVKEAGKSLEGNLPELPHHRKRNPYAHLWERIKAKFKVSYKDIDDDLVDEVLELIEWHKVNKI